MRYTRTHYQMPRYSLYTNHHARIALAAIIPSLASVLSITGCTTYIQRDVTSNNHTTEHTATYVNENMYEDDAAIVGLNTAVTSTDDPGLYTRRDSSLSLRYPGTLAQAESWEPAPAPDITTWQRLSVSQHAESYIFFRQERGREGSHYRRYRR